MVFNTEEEEVRNNNVARQQAIRQARFLKVSGDAVVRVVKRVDNAEENNNLGELLKFYTFPLLKIIESNKIVNIVELIYEINHNIVHRNPEALKSTESLYTSLRSIFLQNLRHDEKLALSHEAWFLCQGDIPKSLRLATL